MSDTMETRADRSVTDDLFSYEGHQVVRGEFFAHIHEPAITFNQCKVSVNTACLRKLPQVDYVQILVDPEAKKLAVRPCGEDEKDSFLWRTRSSTKPRPKQITCRIFFAKIMELMGWNPDFRYRLLGKLVHSNGEQLFLFDLTAPEMYQRAKTGSLPRSRTTPIFPAGWKDRFGLPVEEHRKALQVDRFNGYAVFMVRSSAPPVGLYQQKEKEDSGNGHDDPRTACDRDRHGADRG